MFNLSKITFIENKKLPIFKISNFLSYEYYSKLKSNLPDLKLEDFDEKYVINNKLGLQPGDGIYEKYILSNSELLDFHNKIFNKVFLKKIFNLFSLKIYTSRKDDLSYLFKLLLRKNKYITEFNYKRNNYEKFFFNYIRPSIQYSYMFKDSKIVPHTDSRAKLLSLMLYFPDSDQQNEKIQSSLGTTFYDSKIANLNNYHLNNDEEIEFKKNNKKLTTLPFRSCDLYGFIRTPRAWHTVEKISHDNLVRKSININLLFQ